MNINLQTPGPLQTGPGADTARGSDHFGRHVREIWSDTRENKAIALVLYGSDLGDNDTEGNANARTLAAGFNLLDKTGRALNVDAATLGEGLDLVGLIRSTRDLADAFATMLQIERLNPADNETLAAARAALSTLPALP